MKNLDYIFEKILLIIGLILGLFSLYYDKEGLLSISLLMTSSGLLLKMKNNEQDRGNFFNSFVRIFILYIILFFFMIIVSYDSVNKASKFSFIGFAWVLLMYNYLRSRLK